MSHVTVHFVGICTHISQSTLPELPATQRVVLVNARDGYEVHAVPIPRHLPVLQIEPAEPIELPGCTMRLVTSAAVPFTADPTFDALPNLRQLVQGLTALSAPSAEVVLDRNAQRSACYFDIDFGTLSACLDHNGAAVATLDAKSPEPIWLEIARWDGSDTEVIELPDGTVVWVANADPDPDSKGVAHPFVDFLLHYATAATMPHTPQVPQSMMPSQCAFKHHFQTVGAGCSNSNYP
jgi:hypothetical protein